MTPMTVPTVAASGTERSVQAQGEGGRRRDRLGRLTPGPPHDHEADQQDAGARRQAQGDQPLWAPTGRDHDRTVVVGGDDPPVGVAVHHLSSPGRSAVHRHVPSRAVALPHDQPERFVGRIDLHLDLPGIVAAQEERRGFGRAAPRRDRSGLPVRARRQHHALQREIGDRRRKRPEAVGAAAQGHGRAGFEAHAAGRGIDADRHRRPVHLQQVAPTHRRIDGTGLALRGLTDRRSRTCARPGARRCGRGRAPRRDDPLARSRRAGG